MRYLFGTILLLLCVFTSCQKEPEHIPPEVDVKAATSIGRTGAVLTGVIISSGTSYVSDRMFQWGTDPLLRKCKTIDAGDGADTFSCKLWGLTPGTKYYFRAKVSNVYGEAESKILSFTTMGYGDAVPYVTWEGDPRDVSEFTADLTANIVSDGNALVTDCGFCWTTSATAPPVEGVDPTLLMKASGLGVFEANLKDLKDNTTYYVRAWAKNALGTGYSDVKTFTTLDANRIFDVSIPEFIAAPVSQTRRYRITANIDYIYYSYGVFYVIDGYNNSLPIIYASVEPLPYGECDMQFASLNLRAGDTVTLVGYRDDNDSMTFPQMAYAYVESSKKLNINSFMGYWSLSVANKSKSTSTSVSGLYTQRDSSRDEGDRHYIMIHGMRLYLSSSGYYPDSSCPAEGYYDDQTGRITLYAGLCNHGGRWWYTDDPSIVYKSLFCPVKEIDGSWSTYSDAVMVLEPCWDYGQLKLVHCSANNSSKYYRYDDYVYDDSTSTVTDQFHRSSNVWELKSLMYTGSF